MKIPQNHSEDGLETGYLRRGDFPAVLFVFRNKKLTIQLLEFS